MHLIQAIALAAVLSVASGVVSGQAASEWNPRSGDPWVDTRLADINQYGDRYRAAFTDELTRYYGAPRALVDDLLARRWAPGDIYYACALAQVIGQPCRAVVATWKRERAQGWGALAQRLGVRPGSAAFQRLKAGFVPTYERWSRPLVLDDELRADFPGRGNTAPNAGTPDRKQDKTE